MAITIDGTNGITQPDNAKLKLGNSNDLQIYSDGSSSRIKESGAGSLTIDANNLYLRDETGTSNYITAISGGAASLYHNNSKKLATTSTGIDVTGKTISDTVVAATGGSPTTLSTDRIIGAVNTGGNAHYQVICADSTGVAGFTFGRNSDPVSAGMEYHASDHSLRIYGHDYAERMRIDSSGHVLVGKTSADNTSTGVRIGSSFISVVSGANGNTAIFNRTGPSDGEIMRFQKDNTTVGTIGTTGGKLYIGSPDGSDAYLRFESNQVSPCAHNGSVRDNVIDMGKSSSRFDDIYATNGSIQTSDRNEKQDIEELSEAEQRVAVACKGLMRKFRWKDAVAEKGDDARIHFGIIAQDLQDAFTAEGLDAGKYAMFISTTWWETQTEVSAVEAVEAVEATYDDEGNELTPTVEAVEGQEAYTRTDTYETLEEAPEGATERTRLGVRYPELLAFIISAI